MQKQYTYLTTVVKVYDGDTITCDVDLGFNTFIKGEVFRLYGIDTPEMRGGTAKTKLKAKKVRDFVREKILNKEVLLKTYKDKKGKYGRYLAEVFYGEQLVNLNKELILKGYAKEYFGGKKL